MYCCSKKPNSKDKCYHCRKTGTTNCNGFIGVVKRKQYFVTIVLQIIKKTKRDNIPTFIITSHSNWEKAMERFTSYENLICILVLQM